MSHVAFSFSHGSSEAFMIPREYRSGHCILKIDMHFDTGADVLNFCNIVIQACLSNNYCVAMPLQLRHMLVVGAKGIMDVALDGLPLSNSMTRNVDLPLQEDSHGGAGH